MQETVRTKTILCEISGSHSGTLKVEAESTSDKSENFYQTSRLKTTELSHFQERFIT